MHNADGGIQLFADGCWIDAVSGGFHLRLRVLPREVYGPVTTVREIFRVKRFASKARPCGVVIDDVASRQVMFGELRANDGVVGKVAICSLEVCAGLINRICARR